MVVITIIVIALAYLVPSLAPATGRSLEGAARQFTSDLENARQMAIAERTKTRVLIADTNANPAPPFASDIALRGYTIVSFNKTAGTWKQRGKWTRLPQPATFDPKPTPNPSPSPAEGVIEIHKADKTKIDNSVSGTDASNDFTGAYVEFRPNGSSSLDPNAKYQLLVIADGIPDGNGNMTAKNKLLRYQITIDPLTGSARLQ